jgi:hypothetical protein
MTKIDPLGWKIGKNIKNGLIKRIDSDLAIIEANV